MEKYERGDTIRINVTFKDLNGDYTDPTTPQYSVYKPDGSAYLTNEDLTKDAVGQYHCDIATSINADLGYWEVEIWGFYNTNRILNRETVKIVEVI